MYSPVLARYGSGKLCLLYLGFMYHHRQDQDIYYGRPLWYYFHLIISTVTFIALWPVNGGTQYNHQLRWWKASKWGLGGTGAQGTL